MKFNRITPPLLRFGFDLASGIFVALVVGIYSQYMKIQGQTFEPLLMVLIFSLSLNAVVGLYQRLRTSRLPVKILLLTLNLLVSTLIIGFLLNSWATVILFSVLSYALWFSARFFLNWPLENRAHIVTKTIRSKGCLLVVGGGGYIGTHVVSELLKKGHRVRVLDPLFYGKDPVHDFLNHPKFELIQGDATDISKLVLAMNGATSVIHLAGLVGDPACAVDEEFTRHTNVITTRMVKEVSRAYGIERFVFASSCSVYGQSDEKVDENSNLNPVSLYAKTKIDSERELLASNCEDFNVVILRFATVFGHSRRPRFDLVANLFTGQSFVDGRLTVVGPNQWRPFIHCFDVARACVLALEAPLNRVRGQIFNVGDDRLNMTIGQLGEAVQKVSLELGKNIEITVTDNIHDRRNYMVNFDKIKSGLNFHATYSMADGVREIMKEFEKGTYTHYRQAQFSNVETTRQQLELFHDPMHTSSLYRPMAST